MAPTMTATSGSLKALIELDRWLKCMPLHGSGFTATARHGQPPEQPWRHRCANCRRRPNNASTSHTEERPSVVVVWGLATMGSPHTYKWPLNLVAQHSNVIVESCSLSLGRSVCMREQRATDKSVQNNGEPGASSGAAKTNR